MEADWKRLGCRRGLKRDLDLRDQPVLQTRHCWPPATSEGMDTQLGPESAQLILSPCPGLLLDAGFPPSSPRVLGWQGSSFGGSPVYLLTPGMCGVRDALAFGPDLSGASGPIWPP